MKRTGFVSVLWCGQGGAVLPLVGFIIIALLALAAIAVDVGYILVTKQQLQNAADAGVLAAAPAMILEEPEKTAEVEGRIVEMCARHKAGDEASVTIVPAEDVIIEDNKVTAFARKLKDRGNGLPLFFARILGIRYADVTAKAALVVTSSSSVCCVKPWAIPDIWDDQTVIAGHESWSDNGRWNGEEFTDLNDNGIWNEGEEFDDSNGNGVYDSEYYSKELSRANLEGYIPEVPPDGHLGLQVKLKLGSGEARPASSFFNPVVLPGWSGDDETQHHGAQWYRENIIECNPLVIRPEEDLLLQSEPGNMLGPTNQGVKFILGQDPDAFWNEELNTVDHYGGGALGESPRIVFALVFDPRIWPGPGRLQDEDRVSITKIIAFFLEDVRGGVVYARVAKAPVSCMEGGSPGPGTSFAWSYRLVE